MSLFVYGNTVKINKPSKADTFNFLNGRIYLLVSSVNAESRKEARYVPSHSPVLTRWQK